ncbi:YcaO-like family protein [Cryobacterium sp. GrIS_2_6]|uniref:YcaO-like family protein n=1 Tax=Cryobacterium sp. GrIS_2_6 TaxID=3162785 RepID=UPI002DFE2FAA|nr:SagB-type dehydrogenase family enzyme [Cryobacterium psychrotolerans]
MDGTERKTILRDPERRIAALLEAMDGRTTWGDLSDTYETGGAVGQLVTYLIEAGSIAAAEQLWRPFHATTVNPQHFGSAMDHTDVVSHARLHTWPRHSEPGDVSGPLLRLASRRRSCRSFSVRPLPLAEVRDVLAVAYSAAIRATPSAGGLYSCRIDLFHRSDTDSGWRSYCWDPIGAMLRVRDAPALDTGELQNALDSASLLHGAAAIAIISFDPRIHSAKYANRGYRYSILEAGHVAQMIHLAAVERNLGALEWGAFNDGALARLTDSGSFAPATVVGFGLVDDSRELVKEPNRPSLAFSSFSSFGDPSNSENEPSGIIVAQIPIVAADGTPSGAYATGVHWAESLAGVKARSEFVERQTCGRLQIDVHGSADILQERYRVFDTRVLFPDDLPGFTAEPSEFAPFDASDSSYQWRIGESEADGPTIVPVELIYFPVNSLDMGRRLCGTATSNGVAAHTTLREARRSALLELIERDAFVRHWIAQRPPARVRPPLGIFASKLAKLEGLGIEVAFGQLDAVVPVFFCAAISAQGALLGFGLAADTSANAAIEKAFLDAYATYLTARRAMSTGTGAHVRHYVAYQRPGSISSVRWFFDGPSGNLCTDVDQRSYKQLYAHTCFVDLDIGSDSDLVVVRALNTGLRAIWFGGRWKPTRDPNSAPHFFS